MKGRAAASPAVWVEPTGRRVEPFGDLAHELPILNRPLSSWQREAFAGAGLAPLDALRPPCLVVPDTLFTTAGALRAFVDGAAGRDARLVLKRSRLGEQTTPVQPGVTAVETGHRFEAVRWVSGREDRPPVDVVVDPQERVIELAGLAAYGVDASHSIARHPVMTVHHWVHLLWANQLAGAIEYLATPRWRLALRALGAAARSRSIDRWKVLARMSRIGEGCDVHPTALIEGSTLGDGVTVGPYARVLFSTVGDRATVASGAQVEMSVLGPRTLVTEQTVLRGCVLMEGAVAAQYLMQLSVLGRGAVTTGGGFTMDLNFEDDVKVMLDGELRASGARFLGSAFGHRCRVGAGLWLAAGRSVPNDYFVVRDPGQILSKLAPGLGASGPLAVVGRELVPLRRPAPDGDQGSA